MTPPRVSARAQSTLSDKRYSQSLERGLALLASFTAKQPFRGIADMSDDLRMSRSTTHRYASTLVALGYLEQGESHKYRLGVRTIDLGTNALDTLGLRQHSHPCLLELRERTRLTTSLAVLDGVDIVYVDRAHSFRPTSNGIGPTVGPGSRLPAYCTALGKILLAHLPHDRQRDLLTEIKPTKLTSKTITSRDALRKQLEEARLSGLAINDGELSPALCAIAVPVRDASRTVVAAASIAADASTTSFREMVDEFGPELDSTASDISARLGYRRKAGQ